MMPEICRFLGIVIYMYFDDHAPSHFHAKYGKFEVMVDIETGIVKGQFPKRALRLVLEWYELHQEELMDNWKLAKQSKKIKKIQPLE